MTQPLVASHPTSSAASEPSIEQRPARDDNQARLGRIARRAHELYEARGAEHGRNLDDWLQAEREIDADDERRSSARPAGTGLAPGRHRSDTMAPNDPNPEPGRPNQNPSHATARDREMGRDAPPSGDLGRDERTWTPPQGEQGISNRPDDGRPSTEAAEAPDGQTTLSDPPESGVPSQQGIRGHAQDERPDDEKKTRDRGGRS